MVQYQDTPTRKVWKIFASWKILIPLALSVLTILQISGLQSILEKMKFRFMADVTIASLETPNETTWVASQPMFQLEFLTRWGPSSFHLGPKLIQLPPETDPELCIDPSSMEDWSPYQDSVLLVPRGNCSYQLKALHAQQMGAAAIIIYNTMASRYKLSQALTAAPKTTQDILWPREGMSSDCSKASAMVPTEALSFSPLPYNPSHNNPRLSGDTSENLCQQYYEDTRDNDTTLPFREACPSQRCLVTPTDEHFVVDSSPQVRVCCALDLHSLMGPDKPLSHVTIPALFMTMQQGDDLLKLMEDSKEGRGIMAALSSRGWFPELTSVETQGLSILFAAVVFLTYMVYCVVHNFFHSLSTLIIGKDLDFRRRAAMSIVAGSLSCWGGALFGAICLQSDIAVFTIVLFAVYASFIHKMGKRVIVFLFERMGLSNRLACHSDEMGYSMVWGVISVLLGVTGCTALYCASPTLCTFVAILIHYTSKLDHPKEDGPDLEQNKANILNSDAAEQSDTVEVTSPPKES